ncbi:MAG: type II toxin-antitoxin system RatA family toxin [Candidatus Oxydemutatoraceae bacterium WSBS_2016_MAG_OTU14]
MTKREYSTVDRQNPDGSVHATLGVAHKGFRLQFATVNQGKPFEELSMRLSEGAFKHLGGEWKLTPLGDEGCRVELDFEYEFSNIIYEKLLNQFFDRIAETLMDAFLERAKVRYG